MKSLYEYILETLQMYICEGFDIDRERRVVSFNPNHQDFIDTNDYINPYIILNDTENSEMILSLFERKDAEDGKYDGNPIVYALKNKKGWRFNNPKFDIPALMKRFVSVTKALNCHFDTLVISPSTNQVNTRVFNYLKRLIDFEYSIEDFFEKIPIDEIQDNLDTGAIERFARENKMTIDKFRRKIKGWFDEMYKENNGIFSYQKIPVHYRDIITTAIRLSPSVLDNIELYAQAINDKDVLVFDDTVASGSTLSDSGEALRLTFKPRSITFLTLFSPRKDGEFSNVRVNLTK